MNSKKAPVSSLIRQQYEENERSANKSVAGLILGLVALCIITEILMSLDYSYSVEMANLYVFLPLCGLNVVFCIIAWKKHFSGSWIKIMLLSGLILMCCGFYAIFTTYMLAFLVVPIMVSSRYFSNRITHNVSVATIFLFLFCSVLNIVLEPNSETVQYFHEKSCYNSWSYYLDALVYIITPTTFLLVYSMLHTLSTGNAGRHLLKSRGENKERMAAVEAEFRMASEIQKSVLPENSFTVPGGNFLISAVERSAKDVCGDFYDYFMLNDHTLVFLIADVSDKGTPAAMFMMSACKALRCAVQCCHSLEEAILLANRLICDDNSSGMFLTLWLGMIDTSAGVGKYINAGHPYPVVKHADGTVTEICNEPDLFLGNFPDKTPRVNTFRMNSGDVLLLYTDGITDAADKNGQSFGTAGIFKAMDACSSSAESVSKGIIEAADSFSNGVPRFDDMTLLALQCVSTEPPAAENFSVCSDTAGTESMINGIEALLRAVACPDDVRRNISVITDEICTNICDYAYDGETGPMELSAAAGSNYVTLVFSDEGLAFNPLEHEDPDLSGEPAIGGLGIYLTKELADAVSYKRDGSRNILTVTFIWNI